MTEFQTKFELGVYKHLDANGKTELFTLVNAVFNRVAWYNCFRETIEIPYRYRELGNIVYNYVCEKDYLTNIVDLVHAIGFGEPETLGKNFAIVLLAIISA